MTGRVLLLVAASCAVLAGCGGDGGASAPPADPAKALAEATAAIRDQTLQVRVTRAGNLPRQGRFGFGGKGVMSGDGLRGMVKGQLELPDGESEVEVRMAGADTWTSSPGGAKWVHTDDPLSPEHGLVPWFLGDVLKATGGVDEVGDKQVEGQPATHYRGVADLSGLSDRVLEFRVSSRDVSQVPVDVWLAEGRPKRLRIDFGADIGFYMDIVVLGYGGEEIPGPPPESDVVEAGRR